MFERRERKDYRFMIVYGLCSRMKELAASALKESGVRRERE